MNDQTYGLYGCPPAPYTPLGQQMPPPQQQYLPSSPFLGSPCAYGQAGGWNPYGEPTALQPVTPPAQAYPTLSSPSFSAAPSSTPPRSPQYQGASSEYPPVSCPIGYPGMQPAPSFHGMQPAPSFHGMQPAPSFHGMQPAATYPQYGCEASSSSSYGAAMGLAPAATFPCAMPPAGYPSAVAPAGTQTGYGYGSSTPGPATCGPLGAGLQQGGPQEQPDFCYPGRPDPDEGKFKLSEVKGKDMAKGALKGATFAFKMAFG